MTESVRQRAEDVIRLSMAEPEYLGNVATRKRTRDLIESAMNAVEAETDCAARSPMSCGHPRACWQRGKHGDGCDHDYGACQATMDCVACAEIRVYRQALAEIVGEIKTRAWLKDGRGSYEWNDDDYRREAGWVMDAVRIIAEKALEKRQ